jgi:hypothetical protein
MLDTNRHQHFKAVLHELLSSQDDVTVLKVEDRTAALPNCFIRAAGPDNYVAVRGDSGPVLSATGKGLFRGECEFDVYVQFAVSAMDTTGEGTLEDEGARMVDIIERAIKYGGALETFTTANYELHLHEVMPELSLWWVDERDLNGRALVHGKIRYTQRDL